MKLTPLNKIVSDVSGITRVPRTDSAGEERRLDTVHLSGEQERPHRPPAGGTPAGARQGGSMAGPLCRDVGKDAGERGQGMCRCDVLKRSSLRKIINV